MKELIQYAFLCMGTYVCIAVASILLGCFISKIMNEPDDAMLYAWLTSTAGLTFLLLHIIGAL
jgi:hypothetical protein|nr:MAG TPA: hypothetical protein [Caudoviricetes sp.]